MFIIKTILIFLVLLNTSNVFAQIKFGDQPLYKKTLYSTVQIITPDNKTGSGFIIFEQIKRESRTDIFWLLVTNKHMLGNWNYITQKNTLYHNYIEVVFYLDISKNSSSVKKVKFDLNKRLFEHSNPSIDVALIYISDIVMDNDLQMGGFELGYLINYENLSSKVFLGDQVFVLGFPLGVTSATNNFPIVKSAHVSSSPDEIFSYTVSEKDSNGKILTNKIEGKIFNHRWVFGRRE